MKEKFQEASKQHITLSGEKDVSAAVYSAMRLAGVIGFKKTETFMIGTAVSELGKNIIIYAKRGKITIGVLGSQEPEGIEIIAEDRGPGIADINLALQDNFSTGGTLGIGLPGTKRLMDDFRIESNVGEGTRIRVRKWLQKKQKTATSSVF